MQKTTSMRLAGAALGLLSAGLVQAQLPPPNPVELLQTSKPVTGLLATTLVSPSANPHMVAATYTIDPLRTTTTYELGNISSGRFERHSGTIQLDMAAKTGLADVSIEAASVRSGIAMVDSILVSSELFNASQYPSIRFLSDQFLFSGETLTGVLGNLTLLGKTLPVLLQVNHFACRTPPAPEPEVCSGSFETTIDRTDYGMDLGVSLGMPKSVHLVVQVEAVRQ